MSPVTDPDHNQLEFQVENVGSVAEATEFFHFEDFASNPICTEFDLEELLSRLRAGESADVLEWQRGDRGALYNARTFNDLGEGSAGRLPVCSIFDFGVGVRSERGWSASLTVWKLTDQGLLASTFADC